MRLIDADAKITALLYDEEHEETKRVEMTIADFLDSHTEEGCPPSDRWVSVNQIVRCKNCIHRGIALGKSTFDIKWPDGTCPCQCDDPFYSWLPPDNWYCASGERKAVKRDATKR